MKTFPLAVLVTLLLVGSAQAKNPEATAQSTSADCAQLHMTAFTGLDDVAPTCCAQSTHCPRFLAITPLPHSHRDLRT
jgi:hypothetical protein